MDRIVSRFVVIVFAFLVAVNAVVYLLSVEYYFSALLLLLAALVLGWEFINLINRFISNIDKNLAIISYHDFSSSLIREGMPKSIFSKQEKIRNTLQEKINSQESQKHIYEQIINRSDTGILILKAVDKDVSIFFSNPAFSQLFEIPSYNSWDLVKKHLTALDKYLSLNHWSNKKDLVKLEINQKEQLCSLRTSEAMVYNCQYLIVNIDPVQNIVDKKEKEAWYNLMKVMSHEILNTITPINSLSQNLEYLVDEKKEILGKDYNDIHQSVETINRRTKELADFVETYRSIGELPSPQKERVLVVDLLEEVLALMRTELEANMIKCEVNIFDKKESISIDRKQIQQVFINLFSNAIHALEEKEGAKIVIDCFNENGGLIVTFSDNGKGIAADARRNIFIPFFTTRENGTGIGLSLCRNIMQGHGGNIYHKQQEGRTNFILSFS